jgi:hypothetical protein
MEISWRGASTAVVVLLWIGLASCTWVSAQQPAGDKEREQAEARAFTGENWDKLSLEGSNFLSDKPVLGEKDDFPLFSRELLQMNWRRGDPIDLYVIRPHGVGKPPVILYLYSYPSETDRFRNDDYCVRLTRDGFAAIGFVSALTGHRYRDRPMREWFVSELEESLVTSVHDVQMILNYLSTRDDLDLSTVGMFGAGSGGSIAVLAAATDARIKAIDVLDPWADWPEWMAKSSIIPESERPDYVKPDFLKKVEWVDPVRWLPQLKTPHVRIEQVFDDGVTPKAAKEQIDNAAPATATIVKYESNKEFFEAVSGGRIFQWTKDALRPTPQKPAGAGVQNSAATVRRTEPGHDD